MLQNYGAITQALIGTLFACGLTAAGAGMVVMFKGTQRKLLDTSLGFAGGVMAAASYWSLLAPAIEMAEDSKLYGQYAVVPVALGFLIGALFVCGTDFFISSLGVHSPNLILALSSDDVSRKEKDDRNPLFYDTHHMQTTETTTIEGFGEVLANSNPVSRRRTANSSVHQELYNPANEGHEVATNHRNKSRWKRIVLLIVAIILCTIQVH